MRDHLIEIHGKKVLLLHAAIEQESLPDPCLSDVWVVNHDNEALVKKFLKRVIRSKNLKVYLKPIFLQKEFEKYYYIKDYNLKHLCDGYIKGLSIIDKLPSIVLIDTFVAKLGNQRNIKDFTKNNFLIQKTFDYYYTRKKTIKPVLNHLSLTGYSYPRIEAYFSNTRDAYVVSRLLLQEAYTGGWLNRKYIDTSHLCCKCSSGFLNYREICPKCGKHNLRATHVIHHFRCAYVGTEKDFNFKNKLVCPKCSSELRNIGVDYDRPGKIFTCRSEQCNHEFQDPPVGVNCINCNTEQSPTELLVRKIYEYNITGLGIEKGLLLER